MAFNTLLFLTLFMPLGLLLYHLPVWQIRSTARGRQLLLVLLGLLFYAWGEPRRILLLIGSVLVNYLLLMIWHRQKRATNLLFALAVLLNIGVLIWGKYLAASLPLGLSFYTFKLLSAWFDIRRLRKDGKDHLPSLPDFALYITFFPQVISGPIGRYEHFRRQLPVLRVSGEAFRAGLMRFLPALFIKVLLADPLFQIRDRLLTQPGAAEAWLAALLYTFYIYLDFASYSSMAIGLGQMLGYETPENFLNPYQAINVADFWRRWHITLSSWFRDYVYIPLGGNRKGQGRQILNILIVWALTGIWHGNTLNFLLWGLYYALWLLLEKFFLNRRMERWPLRLRQLITFSIVNFGWVLFAFPDFAELGSFIGALFGQNGAGGALAGYLISGNWLLLLLAIYFCTTLPGKLKKLWRSKVGEGIVPLVVETVFVAAFLILTLAFMLDQSFASFLYFNF